MMKVKLNAGWLELDEEHHLIALLKKLSLDEKKGMAVAVNADVVPRKKWSEFKLNENDEIIIIEAAQGG
jgi:sulfur carrier protein